MLVAVSLLALVALGLGVVWVAMSTLIDDRPLTASDIEWQHAKTTPGVQPNQAFEREEYEQQMQQRLKHYRWESEDHQFASVPIDRAIDWLADQKLASPWTQATTQQESTKEESDD